MEKIKMPNRDGTGPEGKGPKTGRQMGDCKNAKPIVGRGLGPCGRGLVEVGVLENKIEN